jgi:uncharacterized membrane protein
MFFKKNKVMHLTLDAIFSALILSFSFIPYVGFIPLGFTSVTDVHVFVIIGAILLGPIDGLIFGSVFGLCSLLKSIGLSGGDAVFLMPWVSILPRALFGFVCGFLNVAFKKIIKNRELRVGLVAFLSTLIHTLLVYIPYVPTFCWLSNLPLNTSLENAEVNKVFGLTVSGSIWLVCGAIFLFSAIFEALLATIVSIPVNSALEARYGDKLNIKKDDNDNSSDEIYSYKDIEDTKEDNSNDI